MRDPSLNNLILSLKLFVQNAGLVHSSMSTDSCGWLSFFHNSGCFFTRCYNFKLNQGPCIDASAATSPIRLRPSADPPSFKVMLTRNHSPRNAATKKKVKVQHFRKRNSQKMFCESAPKNIPFRSCPHKSPVAPKSAFVRGLGRTSYTQTCREKS